MTKDLAWEKIVSAIFYSAITLIAGYIGYTLKDLNRNVSQLNLQMGTVVERLATTSRDNETLKVKQDEHTKIIYDHEGRIKSLERVK